MITNLKTLTYKFNKGPVLLRDLKKDNFKEANCRLAIQYYLFKIHGLYFSPRSILNPRGYLKTGKFIVKENQFDKESIKLLKEADIIYAERISNKNDDSSREEWITKFHMAIYLGNNEVWHCTAYEGKSTTWTLKKLTEHYNIIAVKRFIY